MYYEYSLHTVASKVVKHLTASSLINCPYVTRWPLQVANQSISNVFQCFHLFDALTYSFIQCSRLSNVLTYSFNVLTYLMLWLFHIVLLLINYTHLFNALISLYILSWVLCKTSIKHQSNLSPVIVWCHHYILHLNFYRWIIHTWFFAMVVCLCL